MYYSWEQEAVVILKIEWVAVEQEDLCDLESEVDKHWGLQREVFVDKGKCYCQSNEANIKAVDQREEATDIEVVLKRVVAVMFLSYLLKEG